MPFNACTNGGILGRIRALASSASARGQIGLAVSRGLSARDLASFADQHPMSAEGISRAARSLF
ncbi:hypothetical protein [Candidatus Mycobacterium methanotrophicum]|uniref:hypothetical protein n=1 Tax=Candidatus Mycobacterium methanotrophicum TaxID=2943498 RepID=UPI001C571DD1|nr:hypothetical protein [Candidatus Mycobacterium methanotrophicum]